MLRFFSGVLIFYFFAFSLAKSQELTFLTKNKTLFCFAPEVAPDYEEILQPSTMAFFEALSDKVSLNKKFRLMTTDQGISFDQPSLEKMKEYAGNNNADYLLVSHLEYIKVGFGRYTLSNQVIIKLKLYSTMGDLVATAEYNTYKKRRRLIGTTKNFIKTGVKGAYKVLIKELKRIEK